MRPREVYLAAQGVVMLAGMYAAVRVSLRAGTKPAKKHLLIGRS